MSGSLTTDGGGDVSITIGQRVIAGWEAVHITRSIESFPSSFSLSVTEQFSQAPDEVLAVPGEGVCVVKIGADVVVTGYVDSYSASIAPGSHSVTIAGRGLCEDLVDCSADIVSADSPVFGGKVSAASTLDLAQTLCRANGVAARCAIADPGPAVPVFGVAPGESPYELIERVCRYSGHLVYEDAAGTLVLDRAGTGRMASGFAQGVNVEAAAATYSVQDRFTTYTIAYATTGQATEGPGKDTSNQRATATDKGLAGLLGARKRPRILISTQTDGSAGFAQRMVDWDMARRNGRAQAVQLTCDAWRDSAGRLWQPNSLARVNVPALKLVDQDWVISTVSFRKDQSGTHADLVLMPPGAFSVEPGTLAPWDLEMNPAAPRPAGSPPPQGGVS